MGSECKTKHPYELSPFSKHVPYRLKPSEQIEQKTDNRPQREKYDAQTFSYGLNLTLSAMSARDGTAARGVLMAKGECLAPGGVGPPSHVSSPLDVYESHLPSPRARACA